MICNSDASISEPTIKILAGIGDGQIKKEKLWHDKQGHIVAQDDAEADSWTSYQLTDDLITYKLGKKSKQLGYFQYKKIGPDYVYHGIVNYENSAGQKILSGQFKDGVPVTTLTKFDKNGQLLLTSPVNGTLKVFTSTGKLSLEGKTVNGLGEGVFTVYDNGKITMLYNFKHGEQYGLQQIFKNDSLKNEFYELPGYERVGYFNYGLQKVKLNGLYGFINRSGVVIISPMYSYAEDFKYGVTAFVTKGNQHFYIDRTGKKLTDAEAERLLLSTDYGLY
jgi:antitoxin component YwqK of YwqJK toxin-antitoxin module